MANNHVLTFHVVEDRKWWESLIKRLSRHHKFITMKDIESYYYQGASLNRCCHITFDDGHRSLYENVFPLVKQLRVPISVYVSPKIVKERCNYWFQEVEGFELDKVYDTIRELQLIGKVNPSSTSLKKVLKRLSIEEIHSVIKEYQLKQQLQPKLPQNITIDEMLEMQESNLVTFGAHTINHPILPNETDESSEYEIRHSIEWLSELTGRRVKYWAFPNGDCTDREVECLKKCGIKVSFSTRNGTRFHNKANPLLIPRTGFTFGSPEYLLFKMIFGKYWDKMRRVKKVIKG